MQMCTPLPSDTPSPWFSNQTLHTLAHETNKVLRDPFQPHILLFSINYFTYSLYILISAPSSPPSSTLTHTSPPFSPFLLLRTKERSPKGTNPPWYIKLLQDLREWDPKAGIKVKEGPLQLLEDHMKTKEA